MKRTIFSIGLGGFAIIASASSENILLIDYGVDSSSLYNSTSNGASLPPTPNIISFAQSGALSRSPIPTQQTNKNCHRVVGDSP